MNKDLDFVSNVKLFNEISGTPEEYNTRKVGLYTALVLEEVSEMIDALGMKNTKLYEILDHYRKEFKEASYDSAIELTMQDEDKRIEYLDACVDIAIVSLGGAVAIGGDVLKACDKVSENNLSKFPIVDGKHTVLKDANGKIMKPKDFVSVKLNDCLR